jgi:hypothetical protein
MKKWYIEVFIYSKWLWNNNRKEFWEVYGGVILLILVSWISFKIIIPLFVT